MRKLFAAAIAFALTAVAAHASPAPGRLTFEVLRNGKSFGRHEFVVTNASGVLRLEEQARFAVRLGPVSVFRYEHDCTATWTDDTLSALGCSTLKDGRRTRFNGRREGDRFVVERAGRKRMFDAATPPTIFLTPRSLKSGVYIDTETGSSRNVRVTPLGSETIEVAGRSIVARRYRIASSITMDLWYDGEGRWVKGTFTARGQRIEYRLASPIEDAPR